MRMSARPPKLATVIDQIEHGHHVFRAYFKSGFLKQYEKFLTFLRNELVSNNLTDFGLLKGLDHLDAVRTTFQLITDRFAGFQAEWLNVHVDFPLLQRLAHPITIGAVRYPGLKIHEPRIIRLFEILLHGGPQIGGWTARQMHQAVLDAFDLSEKTYRLNQLRYDLRKLKGHGLIERDGSRYAYRLSPKGYQMADQREGSGPPPGYVRKRLALNLAPRAKERLSAVGVAPRPLALEIDAIDLTLFGTRKGLLQARVAFSPFERAAPIAAMEFLEAAYALSHRGALQWAVADGDHRAIDDPFALADLMRSLCLPESKPEEFVEKELRLFLRAIRGAACGEAGGRIRALRVATVQLRL